MVTLTLDAILRPPSNFDEAVDLLFSILDDEELAKVIASPQDSLIDLHFSTGLFIRNALQLHAKNNPLSELGNPDEVSMELLAAIWRRGNQNQKVI